MTVKYIIEKERGVWYLDNSLNTSDLILDAHLFTKDEAVSVFANASVYRIIQFTIEAKEFYDELAEEVNIISDIWGGERPWVLYLDELVNFVEKECGDIMDEVVTRHSTFGDALTECAERVVQRYKKIKK